MDVGNRVLWAIVGAVLTAAGALLAAASLATAGTVVFGTTAAHATDKFTYKTGTGFIRLYRNGVFSGQIEWNADPDDSGPGDTLYAYDPAADGWGVEAHLSTGRVASTRGHPSPYWAQKSGNLPENHRYYMWLKFVKGTKYVESPKLWVTS